MYLEKPAEKYVFKKSSLYFYYINHISFDYNKSRKPKLFEKISEHYKVLNNSLMSFKYVTLLVNFSR